MFGSGFAETAEFTVATATDAQSDTDDTVSEAHSFSSSKWIRHFEDSDDEDDEMLSEGVDDYSAESVPSSQTALQSASPMSRDSVVSLASAVKDVSEDTATVGSDDEAESRNVRPKLSHPSSPRSRNPDLDKDEPEWHDYHRIDSFPGPGKLHVVVKDVAYTTYRAVLYYVSARFPITCDQSFYGCMQIYTDTIIFAPLSSSFNSSSQTAMSSSVSLPTQVPSEGQNSAGVTRPTQQANDIATKSKIMSRRDWIAGMKSTLQP